MKYDSTLGAIFIGGYLVAMQVLFFEECLLFYGRTHRGHLPVRTACYAYNATVLFKNLPKSASHYDIQ